MTNHHSPVRVAGKVSKVALALAVFLQQAGVTPALAQSALPSGGSVASGQVSIGTNGNAMTVNQSTPAAIVNWNTFSIGQPNSVTFNQPGAGSAILNRVTGSTPSSIAGQLNANGQVLLVNPNGIAITATGTVNVGGGFVASTLGISDEDFLRGQRKFSGTGASAGVSNAGSIVVGRGGYAALMGGTVSNSGTIVAPMGKVALASGEHVLLDVSGDGFLQVGGPTKSGSAAALIEQKGRISADGGHIAIEAATVRETARQAINLSGFAEARTVSGQSGSIVIGGGDGGAVTVSGTVDVGGGTSGAGGRVSVSGDKVSVSGRVNATGKTGGEVTVRGQKIDVRGASLDVSGKASAGEVPAAASGGRVNLGAQNIYVAGTASAAAPADWSTIDGGLLQTQLGQGNVVLEAGVGGPGSIALAEGSRLAWETTSQLTLQAPTSIVMGGSIAAPQGSLVLQATSSLTDIQGVSIAAASITGQAGYVSLAGRWQVGGGRLALSGRDTLMVSSSAALSADAARGGAVDLRSDAGFVLVSGQVSARGLSGAGGSIAIQGASTTTLLGAKIDASGSTGGGTIALGGTKGSAAASRSYTVDSASTLTADATASGTGGRIELWSQGSGVFQGRLTARGGLQGGNGGHAEISAADAVTLATGHAGSIDVGARSAGFTGGSILIDPANIVIGEPMLGFDIFRALLTSTGTGTDITAPSVPLGVHIGFASSVAVNDTYALIGAPSVVSSRGNAYLYNLATRAWTDLATTAGQPITALDAESNVGAAVALNASQALIGAPLANNRGAAFLFDMPSATWKTFTADDAGVPAGTNTRFGQSVALNATFALIGATGVSTNRGNAYLHNLGTAAWTDLSSTAGQPITGLASDALFGTSVALNADYALIGSPGVEGNRGNAFLYALSGGAWTDMAVTAGAPVGGLESESRFGQSVALNATQALFGAPGVASNRGMAYLYNLSGGAWTDMGGTAGAPISGLAADSQFGQAVALNGTHALFGAPGVASNRGNAFLYALSGGAWTDLYAAGGTGSPSTTSGGLTADAFFGQAVALGAKYALVGAPGAVTNRGNGFLYELSTGTWTSLATAAGQPITSLGSHAVFGHAVALNDTYALFGAHFAGAGGTAYLYNLSNGVWTDLATTPGQPITSVTAASDVGHSVALNGSSALIGAPGVSDDRGNAFLYNLTTGAWTDLSTTVNQPITSLEAGSQFGYSVALSDTHASIGSPGVKSSLGEARRGNAFVYALSSGTWTDLAATLGEPVTSLAGDSRFGWSVALNDTYTLIGAYQMLSERGNAYLYHLSTGGWNDLSTTLGQPITGLSTGSRFGWSVALNNTYALIGAERVPGSGQNRGNAYLYNLSSGVWTDMGATAGAPVGGLLNDAYFGYSAALNNTYALIGARGVSAERGNAWLYELSSGAWTDLSTTPGQPITSLAAASQFGWSVALNDTRALIGARGVSDNRGNAYLYTLLSGAWTDLSTSSGPPVPTVPAGARFGGSVALTDTRALIGAIDVSSRRGNAYLYGLSDGLWVDLSTTRGQPITALANNSAFGGAVALNNSHALIGTPGVATGRGNAYLYNLSSGAWTDMGGTAGAPVGGLQAGADFGQAVALNDTHALIGARGVANNRGNAFLYAFSDGAWTDLSATADAPVNGLLDNASFGRAVALNSTQALIGAPGALTGGNAWLYGLSGGAWTSLAATPGQPITALAADSFFGISAALTDTHALIGAAGVSGRGNAYLYNLSTSAWTDLAATRGQPVIGLADGALFGYAVALNGTQALIGAPGVEASRGNAYTYVLSSGAWSDLSGMAGSPIAGLADSSNFGGSVALNDTYALIGAPSADSSKPGNAWLVYLPEIVGQSGTISTVAPEAIAKNLQTGTLTLTADNDLTVQVALGLSLPGNSLTLRAGRSIAVDAPVLLAGRDATFEANTADGNLGVPLSRLAGAAGIDVNAAVANPGATTTFVLGSQADSGRDTTYGATGTLRVAAPLTAGAVVENAPDAAIVNSSSVTTTGTTTIGGITGGIFINGRSVDLTGATLTAGGSRWLLFNPLTDAAGPQAVTLGASTADFTRFSCTFGNACTNDAVVPASGNGLLYAWAPTLTVTGVGAADKDYDGNTQATITGTAILNGVPTLGALTSDVTGVGVNATAATANFDTPDVGTDKPVTFASFALSMAGLGYVLTQPADTTAAIFAVGPPIGPRVKPVGGPITPQDVAELRASVGGMTASGALALDQFLSTGVPDKQATNSKPLLMPFETKRVIGMGEQIIRDAGMAVLCLDLSCTTAITSP